MLVIRMNMNQTTMLVFTCLAIDYALVATLLTLYLTIKHELI